mgnify:CR=1 FL=1
MKFNPFKKPEEVEDVTDEEERKETENERLDQERQQKEWQERATRQQRIANKRAQLKSSHIPQQLVERGFQYSSYSSTMSMGVTPSPEWIPSKLLLDIRRKIHRDNGPSVYLDDGKVLYFWHGFHVPAWFIEKPERITLSMILREGNIEFRRMLIERYDLGRFLKELGGIEIQKDKFGTLWHVNRQQLEDRYEEQDFTELFGKNLQTKFVEVKDASTDRIYFLQIPVRIKTPKEAIAWTFNLAEKDYSPEIQT